MDYKEPRTERRKKSDKGKEKYEHTGGFSQKHVRTVAAVAAAITDKPKKNAKNSKNR